MRALDIPVNTEEWSPNKMMLVELPDSLGAKPLGSRDDLNGFVKEFGNVKVVWSEKSSNGPCYRVPAFTEGRKVAHKAWLSSVFTRK